MNPYHSIDNLFYIDKDLGYKYNVPRGILSPEITYLAGNKWAFTEKVDGTNIRVKFIRGEDGSYSVDFDGRNDNSQIPKLLLDTLKNKFNNDYIMDLLRNNYNKSMCLYGEGYGEKIQKVGSNYTDGNKFVLFDIKINDTWLTREHVLDIASHLSIDVVPVIGNGTIYEAVEMTRNGFNSTWNNKGTFIAEGIIAKPEIELVDRRGKRIITKIKHEYFYKGERG